jgi:DNA-binding NtrC family response regulator
MSPILIVDDDAEIRKTLSILLAGAGLLVEESNGPDALRRIESEKPWLMLLDIVMPVMGGIAVLQAAMKISPGLIVLMLTGESDIDIAKGALDFGARAYITKPFDGPALRREIEDLKAKITGVGGPAPYRPWRLE